MLSARISVLIHSRTEQFFFVCVGFNNYNCGSSLQLEHFLEQIIPLFVLNSLTNATSELIQSILRSQLEFLHEFISWECKHLIEFRTIRRDTDLM
jgi:hypothetical protein